ncbi:MAG: HAMP domain-containing histidine kinase, partial [Arcobacteraceae bacterium]|nr:HAMP domain-containing histidine kinase [Arcobacteraceae bacterium]
ASMGEMIGNIAHQWRQPLATINSSIIGIKTKIAMEKYDLSKEEERGSFLILLNTKFNSIENNVEYLSTTIDTFQDFIKEKKEIKKVILQDRIDLTLNILEVSLSNNFIELKNNVDYKKPIEITMVIGELSQVLTNIINNAKDVLKQNKVDKPWIAISLVKKENIAIITIEDNGGGIPDDIMPRIFDPYFTTKHESQGTGLGLHMSYKIIVESLKGRLWAENTNNGAKFFIELSLS